MNINLYKINNIPFFKLFWKLIKNNQNLVVLDEIISR